MSTITENEVALVGHVLHELVTVLGEDVVALPNGDSLGRGEAHDAERARAMEVEVDAEGFGDSVVLHLVA